MPVANSLVEDRQGGSSARVLMKDGIWQVPPEERPKGWESMGISEPLPCALRELPEDMNTISEEKRVALESAFARGASIREAAAEVGVAKRTAETYKAKSGITAKCECGQDSGHRGWCAARYAKSEKRQEVVQRFHAKETETVETRVTERTVTVEEGVSLLPPTVEPIQALPPPPEIETPPPPPVSLEPLSWIPEYSPSHPALVEAAIQAHAGKYISDEETEERWDTVSTLSWREFYHRDAKRRTDALLGPWVQRNDVQDQDIFYDMLADLWRSVYAEIYDLLTEDDPCVREVGQVEAGK